MVPRPESQTISNFKPTQGPRIYVDHAATTPMREEAIAAMLPYFASVGFNPSSLHAEGRAARAAVDGARDLVASVLHARPREIVFVGSGSEANTLAIVGAVRAARANGRPDAHVVTVATEHHAVLHAVGSLASEGVETTVLPVDEDGRVDPSAFAAAFRPQTVLASVMLANNEIGTLAPIAELVGIARARGALFHCDAVAAPGRLPLDVRDLGVDLLALASHKFYGPKGVGALYVRTGTPLAPLVHGGGQEAGLRAGTENVAGIVGFARALELAVMEEAAERPRLAALQAAFESRITAGIVGTRVNAGGATRLASVSSIAFADVSATELLVRLDLAGVAASAGSACAAGVATQSHVIAALGSRLAPTAGTLRFSFGRLTGEDDIEPLVRTIGDCVGAVRVDHTEMGTASTGSSAHLCEVHL